MAYSVQRAVSDGTLSTITLDIDFFAKEHISVLVADRSLPNDDYTYSWIGSNTIKIVPNVANGAEVLIRRNTPYGESFHNFRLGAVFKDETMDENFKQVLFLTQEAIEGQTSTDFYTDLNVHGYKLRNVGPAIAAFDAIPYSQYQGDAAGAYQNRLAADASRVAATGAATSAAGSASAAAGSASTAGTQASAAAASATTASQKATEASTSAANASSSASAASSSASAAAGSLASVNASATAALNSQNAAKASETAAAASASTASTKASDAATSAAAASSSATAASTSATSAGTSATAANAFATSASNSATTATMEASNAAMSANAAQSWAHIAQGASIPDASITSSKLSADVNAKFVGAAGGTMTGNLSVPSLNGGQLAGMRNKIINGKMEIAQRGTSFAAIANATYSLDRWVFGNSSSAVLTASQQGDVPSENEFQNSLRFTVTTADTSIAAGDQASISQCIEGFNVRDLIGRTFTLSFRVRSSKTGIHCVAFRNVAGDRSYVAEYIINSANTWEYKTVTVSGGLITTGTWDWTNGNGVSVSFTLAAGSTFKTTAGAWQTGNLLATANQVNCLDTVGNIFAITGIQLEVGSVATSFEHRPYGAELALCQRYYEVVSFGNRSNGSPVWGHSTPESIVVSFKQEKRITPTVAELAFISASHNRLFYTNATSVWVQPPYGSSGVWHFYGVSASASAEL